MARLGIVGFANSGKTTLFNALTGLDAATAAHPYNTTEPNLGVARIPDPKLDAAGKVENSAKVVPATLELLDLPALSPPGSEGGGLGGQFLGRLREMDALVVVLRAFSDPSVASEDTATDPTTQAEELLLELALADHEVLVRRAERLQKEADRLTRAIESQRKKLSNEQFASRAPVDVVQREREKLDSWSGQLDELARKRKGLGEKSRGAEEQMSR